MFLGIPTWIWILVAVVLVVILLIRLFTPRGRRSGRGDWGDIFDWGSSDGGGSDGGGGGGD